MKVLQLGKFYPILGGVEKVMYDLMLGLSASQIYCDMLCASAENTPAGETQINSYAKLIVVPSKVKLAATMLAPTMISKLRKIAHQYDIIHIHHPDPMATLALYLSGFRGKVVLHWHSDIYKQKKLLKLYKPLQDWLIKKADLIVGTTPVYVDESPFLQKFKHKLDYIPIGVEPIQAEQSKVDYIRAQHKGKFLIYSLGRLVSYKGYEYLVKAAQYLDDRHKIIIGGKGPLKEELENLIDELHVRNKVELVGFLSDEDSRAYFKACDLFALSSTTKNEAFAIVQIEAMSCSKPVISAEIKGSGVSWVNKDGVSGIVIPTCDEHALAHAIQTLSSNSEQYTQLTETSYQRYNELFTRERMVVKCLQLYNNIL